MKCDQACFGDKDLDSIKCSDFHRVVQQTIKADKTPWATYMCDLSNYYCIKENLSDRQDSFVL
jgi:hypothetical protein